MRAVRGRECVVHKEVAERGQTAGKRGIVRLIFFVIADVLEQQMTRAPRWARC